MAKEDRYLGIFTVLLLLGVSLIMSFYVMWTLGKAEQNSEET